MSKNIKYIVLNNGMELIGNVVENDGTKIELQEPYIIFTKPISADEISSAIIPYLPMIEEKTITIYHSAMQGMPLTPRTDLLNMYTSSTSKLFVPQSKGILHG